MELPSEILQTTSENEDFRALVAELDAELARRDGAEHAFYHQYNGLAGLDRAVVVYLGGQAAGCGALKAFGDDALEVKRMYTRPAFRGRGVAGYVLKRLEQWATVDGFARCVLETGRRQPEAIALYEKHGFGRIPNFGPYAGVDNSLCFEKRLTGQSPERD